jgi:hypothetical protein
MLKGNVDLQHLSEQMIKNGAKLSIVLILLQLVGWNSVKDISAQAIFSSTEPLEIRSSCRRRYVI